MLKMGVPVHAVAQKMQLEGFDPGVLSGEGEGEIGGGGVGAMPPPPPLIPPVAKPAEDGAEAPVSGGSQAATEVLAATEVVAVVMGMCGRLSSSSRLCSKRRGRSRHHRRRT